MKDNFKACLKHVLESEGGFVNHPKDPGGATNKGITLNTFKSFYGEEKTVGALRKLTEHQAATIYRANYWNKIKGDDLPYGVDLAVFDYAVNSGVKRAAKALQHVVGTLEDGEIGPKTIEVVSMCDEREVIKGICDLRLNFLQSLKSWETFGKGWKRRVQKVYEDAVDMVY